MTYRLIRPLIVLALFVLVAACGDIAEPIPASQKAFAQAINTLEKELKAASDSGNEITKTNAEKKAESFLRQTQHTANNWQATIKKIQSINASELWITAENETQEFRLVIIDPSVLAWGAARKKGEKIKFSGDLGREQSITTSGGLRNPEFTFWPQTVQLMEDKTPQTQSTALIDAANLKAQQAVLDTKAEMAVNKICRKTVLKQARLPEDAKFSWLEQAVKKKEDGNWLLNDSIKLKNSFGVSSTKKIGCLVKVNFNQNNEAQAILIDFAMF